MNPIDVDELSNRKFIINKLESGLNEDAATEESVVAEDKTEASVAEEVVREDTSVMTKINKRGKVTSSN